MRWKLLAVAALGAALVSVLGGIASGQTAAERGAQRVEPAVRPVALVIGNGGYRAAAPLANPPNDARAMAEKLRALGFELVGGRAQIDLDRAALEGAIQQFGRTLRQGGGVGRVFYAGHGLQVNGQNYLVPVGADVTSIHEVRYQLVDADAILDEMGRSENTLNILILDACRNNPFAARGFRGDRIQSLARRGL